MGGIVRLQLLGPFQAERDRAALRGFESRKAMALLCYLAVQVHPISRSYLANLFWGDKPEGRGRGNLSRVLHNLSTLLPGCLQADRHTVQFRRRPKFWLDVDAFDELAGSSAVDSLAKAFELYRGDFLAGFHLDDCPEFETWLVVERERWHQRAAQVLQKLLDHYSRGGEYERGLGFAARLLELDPWREEAHRQMMFLLAQSGQRSAALAQFETCRHILAEELGVEPATETTALYQRIRDDDLSKNVVGPLDYTQHSQGSGDQILSPAPPHLRTPAPPAFLAAASPQPGLTAPFVARQQELAGLEAFLELALAGQGRVAFVVGEAGRGKTALIEEFSRRAQDRYADLIVAGGNCNAYTGIGDPYLPFREILSLLSGDFEARWLAGIISPEHARRLWSLMSRTVQALVEVGPDLIDIFIPGLALVSRAAAAEPGDAAWLAQLKRLVVRDPAGQSPVNLQQRVLFEQYARVLQVLARKQPLLLVLDDLQWADAGSTSLLFHLGRQLKGSRILIAGLYRPAEVSGREGERHPLEGVVHEFQRHFGDIQIDLGQAVGKLFVEAFLDTEPNRLGPEFREVLYRHTRGHALFTIEMVRGMQERGDLIQDEAGRWVEGQNVDWQRLPARVEGVIGERLGRLPATLQEVLKVASVEGEHFTAEVVAQVLALGEREVIQRLSSALDLQHRLVRGQGSQRLGDQRLSHYRFRHILFQRYVYNSLDEVQRVYLHETVGQVLERLYGDQTEEIAGQLARHFQAAGLVAKAIDYLRQAGERAVRLSANQEAIVHFSQALALLDSFPDTPKRARQELDLRVALSPALVATKGYAAPAVGQNYTRARELCQQVEETPQLFPVLHGLLRFYLVRAEYRTASELGQHFLNLVQPTQDPALLLEAHRALGTSAFHLGDLALSQAHLQQGLALYDSRRHRAHAVLYGVDPGVICLSYTAWTLWLAGYPDRALEKGHEALSRARRLSNPHTLAAALTFAAILFHFRREAKVAQERAEAALTLATEQGFSFWLAWGTIWQGWAMADQGEFGAGITRIHQGLDTSRATGAETMRMYFLSLLAETYLKAEQVEKGLAVLAEALAVPDERRERWWEAELYRLRGELLREQDAAETGAEACFRQAVDIARQQGARSLELRATVGLSRLWHRQGQKEEARQVLAEIYNWFTEGFDTPDLIEAKSLLEECQSG